jgi:hypothetical protein
MPVFEAAQEDWVLSYGYGDRYSPAPLKAQVVMSSVVVCC